MSWYCWVGSIIIVFPFVCMVIGYIASIFRRGPAGVDWRFNIAHTFDMYLAACAGFATTRKKATISGWCGYKKFNSDSNIWDIYVWCINAIFRDKTHCYDAAEQEGWLE